MSSTITASEALYEGGPTLEKLGDPSSSWHIHPLLVEPYRELIAQGFITRKLWRELERLVEAGATDGVAGTVLFSWRNQAMEARGERVMPDRVPPLNEGWGDAGRNLIGFGVHVALVAAASNELHSREFAAALAAVAPRCGACGAEGSVRADLCDACHGAKRWIVLEADRALAAEKVGGKLTGKTREQLVRDFLAR